MWERLKRRKRKLLNWQKASFLYGVANFSVKHLQPKSETWNLNYPKEAASLPKQQGSHPNLPVFLFFFFLLCAVKWSFALSQLRKLRLKYPSNYIQMILKSTQKSFPILLRLSSVLRGRVISHIFKCTYI